MNSSSNDRKIFFQVAEKSVTVISISFPKIIIKKSVAQVMEID